MSEHVETTLKKRPSISDVALEAGVSKAAVSKVIRNAYGVSPAMRARVESAIELLEYRPRLAARVMRGASFTIGFEIPNLGNDFFTQITEGAASRLAGSGYQLILAPGLGYLSATSVLDALIDRQVAGVIAISSDVPDDWMGRLATHVPLVLIGRHHRAREYDTVNNDDRAGANLVMDHLFELGHQRIAHLTSHPPTDQAPEAIRLATYRRRMKLAGFVPQVEFIDNLRALAGVDNRSVRDTAQGSLEQESCDQARHMLQAAAPPTAIFAGYDAIAIGVLRAVAELGLTAEDVSVAGYDDIALAGHPLISLTTVDQTGVTMGQVAIDLLMQRIRDGRTSPKHHRIKPQLRIRKSTQAART